MKRIFTALFVVALALQVNAGQISSVRFIGDYSGTNGAFRIVTTNTINGHIEAVRFDAPAAGVTGTVSVVLQPNISTMASINLLASQTVSADVTVYPRVYGTDASGNIPSTNFFGRIASPGYNVVCTITNIGAVSTGIVWNGEIVYESN